jgi:hypothetical protein
MLKEADLEQYRSVSFLAISSFVIGWLSAVALATPGLWFVPIIGLLCGALGVYRTSSGADRLAGKGLAVCGLCLSIFFGSWAPVRYFARQKMLESQSIQFCEDWLRLVLRGQLEPAHQAYLNYRFRQPEGTSLANYYGTNERDRKDMEKFFSLGITSDLRSLPPTAVIRHQGTAVLDIRGDTADAIHTFEVTGDSTSRNQQVHVRMHVQRQKIMDNIYWTLIGIADDSTFSGGHVSDRP